MKSINLVIPLYNEELILTENVKKILDFIAGDANLRSQSWQIVLADNGSTDKTAEIAKKIAGIKYLFIPQKGKGRAIKEGWQRFPADYYIFMDADLSTDLEALPRLIAELEKGADIVIGSRYLPAAKIKRSLSRQIISKIYRFLAKTWLGLPFSDLPCGFKGVNQKIVVGANGRSPLLPQIKNNEWFFDTELLYRSYQAGYKIKEIPVIWTGMINQKRKSRVGLIKVSWGYLKELWRTKFAKKE